jgi:glycosyltransferase involved in cell wall biosynthesis
MRPLRFCHLPTFYPPHNFGGDGVGIQRLCRALARRGHEVTVVYDADAYATLGPEGEPKAEPEPPGLTTIALRSASPRLNLLLTQQTGRPIINGRRVEQLLRAGNFDVINYHNASLIGGPGLFELGDAVKLYMAHEHWLVCASHVLWRHGRELCTERQCLRCVLSHKRPPQTWRYTGLLERQGRHVDRFIAMSEFSRKKHAEYGFPFEMEVLPYFLPDPEPEPAPAAEADPPHERPYFLFVGRLEMIKGLQEVIPLFQRYDAAELVIAGAGDYEPELRALAAGNPRVRFLGRVPLEQLARYYRHALSLIVPSLCYETFGIIVIEAFRQRTPVIARRIGPLPETVEQAGGGELFSSVDELEAAMARIQRQPALRAQYAEAGYQAYVDHYSESQVVPRYLDVIRRAAQAKGDRRVLEALTP